jgi:UDP-GlcNAc3NAcA epimerase
LVITDSGGLQKEAFFFQKNCVTMRDQTEWVELIENGYNVLVGADKKALVDQSKLMLNKKNDFSKNLYGGGNAGNKIVTHMSNWFTNK